MKARILLAVLCLGLAGCASRPSFISIDQILAESKAIKASADAGSTKGVAQGIANSATISNAVASAQVAGDSKVGDILIKAGKAVNDPTTVTVIGAGVTAGASAAGMDDPSKAGVMGQAAAGLLGGLLVAAGVGLNAWNNRKKQAATPPPPPSS